MDDGRRRQLRRAARAGRLCALVQRRPRGKTLCRPYKRGTTAASCMHRRGYRRPREWRRDGVEVQGGARVCHRVWTASCGRFIRTGQYCSELMLRARERRRVRRLRRCNQGDPWRRGDRSHRGKDAA